MKRLDLLPKIADDYRIGTVPGGLLSIAALITTVVLAGFEVSQFLRPPVKQILLMDTRKPTGPDGVTIAAQYQAAIQINFQIKFPHAPCYLLHFDAIESFTETPLPLDDTDITFTRLSKRGSVIGAFDQSVYENRIGSECGSCFDAANTTKCCNSCRAVLDAYERSELSFPALSQISTCQSVAERLEPMDSEGCEVVASYRTIRIKSQFHVSPGMSSVIEGHHVHNLLTFSKTGFELNLSHTITNLYFGDREPETPGPLAGFTTVQEGPGSWATVYTVDIIADEYSAERYIIENRTDAVLGVLVDYDISPLVASASYNQETLVGLLTRLVMLLGGVLFMFRIFDSAAFMETRRRGKARLLE
jgi:hypothetical protein